MARIENETQYRAIMARIEDLLPLVDDNTPADDANSVELVLLCDMVAEYDNALYPPKIPTVADILKLRMYENNLTQKEVGELLGVSASRVSEYVTGKSEPTLQVARAMVRKLGISPVAILGMA